MPGVFEDTLRLLMEAHDYFHTEGLRDQASYRNGHRLIFSGEMSRITMRLSSVMAWLMMRKAVASGNLSAAEAEDILRANAPGACLSENPEARTLLPVYFNYLLDASLALYQRAWRLNRSMQANPH